MVQWKRIASDGVVLDLEPIFNNGPGVAYLWAKVQFPVDGDLRILAASGVGAVVFVDGKRISGYHDEEPLDLDRPPSHSLAEFRTPGESVILIKTLRNRKPASPLVVAFYDRDGRVIHPVAWAPMPQ